MKRIALLGLILTLVAPTTWAAGSWMTSLSAAQREAKKGNQLILVDMFAEWCGWCHRMEQEVFTSDAFQKNSRSLVLLRLDTEDGGEGTKLARELNINSLPTFVVFTADMQIAGIIRGYSPPDAFVAKIEQVKSDYKAFQKELASEPKLPESERLDIAKQLIERRDFAGAETRMAKLATSRNAAIRDEALYQLALVQAMQKKYDASVKTINAFAQLRKTGQQAESAQLLLAQIYMERGDYPSALREYRKFKSSFPTSPAAANIDYIVAQLERQVAQTKK